MKMNRYKFLLFAALIISFAACSSPTDISSDKDISSIENNFDPIEGQYIVVMKSDSKFKLGNTGQVGAFRKTLLSDVKISEESILNRYNTVFAGFTAKLTPSELDVLRGDSRVDYIEQDMMIPFAPPPGKGPSGGDYPTKSTNSLRNQSGKWCS